MNGEVRPTMNNGNLAIFLGLFRRSLPRAFAAVCIPMILCLFVTSSRAAQTSGVSKDLSQMTLEELMDIEVSKVYAASKYEQKTTEAPSSITIIRSDDIRKYGYRTLADILRSVRGFYVTNDRNYSYIGVRGFARPGDYNSRILVLVDGHRINDNVDNGVLIGQEFVLDVDLIKRVEIVRGPGSSLYGSNAFFAVINVITKDSSEIGSPEFSGEAGSFNTYKGRLSYGAKIGDGAEMLLSGSLMDSKGQNLFFREYDSPETHNGSERHCDYERNYSLFSKSSYLGFTLEGAYVSRTKGIPTGSYETRFDDPRTRTIDQTGYLDLSYDRTLGQKSALFARIYYDYYSYRGDYTYEQDPKTLNKDSVDGQWIGGELRLLANPFEGHKLTLGAEYQYNFRQDQKNYDIRPFSLYLNDKRNSSIWALYLQDEFQILRNLIFHAGLRYDRYETFGSTVNPRLALIYSPRTETTIKLVYGEAFRTPNIYELYYEDGSLFKSNPDLKPEKIRTSEIILEQHLGNGLMISVSGFYYKISDLISQRVDPTDGFLIFDNMEDVRASGVEVEADKKWENGVEGRVSYSFQDVRDEDTDKWLTNSPRHMAKLNVKVPLIRERVFLGVEEQYLSKRKTLADRESDSFFITNLTLFSQGLLKGLEISGSVYNLFGETYADPVGKGFRQDAIEQDGRNFRVKLTYRF